jgi:hypothetical protein
MDLEPYHAWRSCGRKPMNVGEVSIERNQNAVMIDGEFSHRLVGLAGQSHFGHGHRIMA